MEESERLMAKFRNISGNTLEIPSISRVVEDDGVFEVPDEQASGFDCQPTNYERLDADEEKA
jgi:hypothetical protein